MDYQYRLDFFKSRSALPRFWWFTANDYLPPLYADLSDAEFDLLIDWFDATQEQRLIGECNIPAMSEMLGFVTGNGIDRIVQCGHYSGYSTLLMGWALKRMGKLRALYSIDIDARVTAFTQEWVDKAGLGDIVHLEVGDSADPKQMEQAVAYYGWQGIKMVFIDSSHQYAQTLRELKGWYEHLLPGGLIFLHDVSDYAESFDTTGHGGVRTACVDFLLNSTLDVFFQAAMLNTRAPQKLTNDVVLQDSCGFGIIQKSGGSK